MVIMSEANETNDEVSEQVSSNEQKMVPLKELIELRNKFKETKGQLDNYLAADEDRKNKELSEIEKLKKENTKYLEQIRQGEIKSKKHSAFLEAKAKLGEGYVIENEDKVYSAIEKLSFNDETYQTDINDLLEIAKKPKKQDVQVFNLGASNVNEKKASDYTGAELRQIQEQDPERFKQIVAERKRK